MSESKWHGVFLNASHVGDIQQVGNNSRFLFADDYWNRADRPVLGAWFEDNPGESPRSSMVAPSWFSNLLPEGRLRSWIAADQGVSPEREIELLVRIGHDLPGAVVIREGSTERREHWDPVAPPATHSQQHEPHGLRFSLAGVAMKFSMLQTGDHLVLPAADALGDWIVKLPDHSLPQVPSNEAAMMTLAGLSGLEVPEHKLVHRDVLDQLPQGAWLSSETQAYAVRRFDREQGTRIHIEDFAQVRNMARTDKYNGTFETIAALSYRGTNMESLREWARRMAFNLAIGNGDAHLKNWSFIYRDGKHATLSPVYDLVSTVGYISNENFALKFTGSRDFARIRSGGFQAVEKRLEAHGADLEEIARNTVAQVALHAPDLIEKYPTVRDTLIWVAENAQQVHSQLWR